MQLPCEFSIYNLNQCTECLSIPLADFPFWGLIVGMCPLHELTHLDGCPTFKYLRANIRIRLNVTLESINGISGQKLWDNLSWFNVLKLISYIYCLT